MMKPEILWALFSGAFSGITLSATLFIKDVFFS